MSAVKAWFEDEKEAAWNDFVDNHLDLYRLERDLADMYVPADEIESYLEHGVYVIEHTKE